MSQKSIQPTALEETLPDTLKRWASEAVDLERQGAYKWLCSRVNAQRVLEIGCGFGHSTLALSRHDKTVFALDNRMDCLEAAQALVPDAIFGLADVGHVHEQLIHDLNDFSPQAMVLWIGGAPSESLPRNVPAQYAVMQYRLAFQQAAVALAAQIKSIKSIHLADRTAFPWSMKDTGRQTVAQLIKSSVIGNAPFAVECIDVQFRKLTAAPALRHHALPGGMVPVLSEATLVRVDPMAPS